MRRIRFKHPTKLYWKEMEKDFAYIKTYSCYRGEAFEQKMINLKEKKELLYQELSKIDSVQNAEIREQINNIRLESIYGKQFIDVDGKKHQFTEEIATIPKNDKRIKKLRKIFQVNNMTFKVGRCAPIYRDAIVFYSEKNEIVGILHICFGCRKLIDEKEEKHPVNDLFYDKLKKILIGLGHQIYEER